MNLVAYLVLILCIFISANSYSIAAVKGAPKQFVVVIDPGHGGKDPGAVNKSIREKEVVLNIGLKLGKMINENHPDVKVIYTRNTDVFVPLIERSRIANRNKADLFISIHANACPTPAIRGTETFFLGPSLSQTNLEIAKKENSVILLEEGYNTTYEGFDPNSSESYIMFEMAQSVYMDLSLYFADAIQQQFKSRIETPNRGVKQAGFLVLKLSSMPSVLVEAGFLSNQAEANYLNSEDGQHHIALSIFEAFKKFKGKSSGTGGGKNTEVVSVEKKPETTPVSIKKKDSVEIQTTEVKEVKDAEVVLTSAKLDIKEPEKTEVVLVKEPEKADVALVKEPAKADIVLVADTVKKAADNATYYSVQIAASTTSVEPAASNFKGLKNVRREKTDKYYRFYVGKETSLETINGLLKQIKSKFPQAFIVSFVDGKRVLMNTGAK